MRMRAYTTYRGEQSRRNRGHEPRAHNRRQRGFVHAADARGRACDTGDLAMAHRLETMHD